MKIFGLEINFFKNNIFKFNNVNYMIRDLHNENKELQHYLDSSKSLFEALKLNLNLDENIAEASKDFRSMREKGFK